MLFTYLQNFDCVDQPTMDLDFNGRSAASDPAEMQRPNCQLLTEPSADPAGGDLKQTAQLYVWHHVGSSDGRGGDGGARH